MSYSQEEVDMLLEENQQELMRKLETISKEARKTLQKKGKLLSYGQHLHIIPKHKFRKVFKIARGEE